MLTLNIVYVEVALKFGCLSLEGVAELVPINFI